SSDYPEISVMNNCAIRPEELHKIDARIRKAYTYNDITEAFGDVLDDSEGAGLGLIMSLLVFKSSGFDRKDFSVKSEPNRTIFSVRLSENAGRRLLKETITDEITAVVEYIPSFRENILRLIELCDSPEATIHEISAFIKTDPGLTSSILKQANSAGYLTAHRVSTIEEAVKKIGLSGIKTLATATGVDGIIHELFPQFKQQWETSQRKAFYAYKIAIQEKNSRISDKAYLAALISNIGTIALMSAKKEIMNSIATLTGIKDMSQSDLLEEITIGISHSTLSAVITERWNFNKDLSTTIKYHTRPHLAPEPLQDLVRTVYLAHILIEYQNKRIRYQSIDQEVLWYFNISSEEEFRTLNSILDQAFGSGEVKA
ncbi:MAG: HDOD domain-containing protein, partial [Spirochaetota bacterium]